jgi:hypothetical protein
MNQKLAKKWATYIGIAASFAVPTVVIAAQQQRNPPADGTFAAQTLLRAADVEQLRDALADAVTRVNELQANAGVALNKANLYPIEGSSGPIPQNVIGLAQASCEDDNDILLGCSCEGREAGVNSLQFDLRRVTASNRLDGESFCVCQGANVGSNATRVLLAIAQCLEIP